MYLRVCYTAALKVPTLQDANSMPLKKLPIGYSSLINIRQESCVYVDKSQFVKNLVDQGKYYFLSRPRRFGKSLFLDTLHQAFIGNKKIFAELYLEHHWDWSAQYPVIRFGFSGVEGSNSAELLDTMIRAELNNHAEKYEVEISKEAPHSLMLATLIKKLFNKYAKPVVVLVDECDKPILDVIEDKEKATANREVLKNFYGALKELDQYLKFVFLTGVSKFSKVNLFSGLNNLNDISLDARYADICGYTQDELEITFKEYLTGVNQAELKSWYNGYNFEGSDKQKVYNPFDILLFFDKGKIYKNYWFETGSPAFLIKLLETHKYYLPQFENLWVVEESLSGIDINNIPFEVLAFQTGYLTIKNTKVDLSQNIWYELGYPNLEVKKSLNAHVARLGIDPTTYGKNIQAIYGVLSHLDFHQFKTMIQALFSSIPNDWYRNNDISHFEGFYCITVYSYFCSAGYEVIGEDVTSKGRIDLTIKAPNAIFIFEFKMKKNYDSAQDALNKIKAKNYADKYKTDERPVYLIGMIFDEAERNLVDFIWEVAE